MTALARQLLPEFSANEVDLEVRSGHFRLDEPRTALEPLRVMVVIDEGQRRPDLFPILCVPAGREAGLARFPTPGSARSDLMHRGARVLERCWRTRPAGFGAWCD